MANAFENTQVLVRGAADVERRFMAAVYRWMTFGLLVTAGVAFYVATTPEVLQAIFGNRMVFWGLIIAQFGLVIALSAAVNKLSAGVATVATLWGPFSREEFARARPRAWAERPGDVLQILEELGIPGF